jgi:hypothetical protein
VFGFISKALALFKAALCFSHDESHPCPADAGWVVNEFNRQAVAHGHVANKEFCERLKAVVRTVRCDHLDLFPRGESRDGGGAGDLFAGDAVVACVGGLDITKESATAGECVAFVRRDDGGDRSL